MTDHRCDAHARVTDLYGREVRGAVTRCELFLGHEGDHRVTLAWPDADAAAQDAEWSAERLDPDETFDVEVPIEKGPAYPATVTPRACDALWGNDGDGVPWYCGLAAGHAGEHALYAAELREKVTPNGRCVSRRDDPSHGPRCTRNDGHRGLHWGRSETWA